MPLIFLYFLFFCLFQKVPRTIYTEWWRNHTGHQQAGIYSCVFIYMCSCSKKQMDTKMAQTHMHTNCCLLGLLPTSWRGQSDTWVETDNHLTVTRSTRLWRHENNERRDRMRHVRACTMHTATHTVHTNIYIPVTLMCVTRTITTRRQTLRMGVFYQKIPWHIFQHRKDSENHCNWKTII